MKRILTILLLLSTLLTITACVGNNNDIGDMHDDKNSDQKQYDVITDFLNNLCTVIDYELYENVLS